MSLAFSTSNSVLASLEAAAANPEALSQEAIIDNLDPSEAARLDKVRNIGIAVYNTPQDTPSPFIVVCLLTHAITAGPY